MTSKERAVIDAFVGYASDTEGMRFEAVRTAKGWAAKPAPGTVYSPVVVAAVKRNFREEFGR